MEVQKSIIKPESNNNPNMWYFLEIWWSKIIILWLEFRILKYIVGEIITILWIQKGGIRVIILLALSQITNNKFVWYDKE